MLRRAWPPLALALFAVAMLYPQLLRMDAVPDLGDPLFSMWRMGWVHRQLAGDPRPLFDANIFHPEQLTFAYSDSMLLPSLAAAPLLAAGVHPVIAYNLLLVASFYLSAVATYLLVRDLTGSRAAGFVSGLIFGFYPFRFEHYSHLELQIAFWMPLALWCLHRFAATSSIRWALAAAAFAVAQLYSSMYLALFFVCYVPFVAAALAFRHRDRLQGFLPGAIAAAFVGIVAAVPLARVYLANPEVAEGRTASEVSFYSAARLDYLRAQRRSVLWAHRTPPGRMVERQLFPGVMPLVLTGAGLLSPGGLAVKAGYAAAMLFAYEASHGPNGIVFPWLADLAPFAGIRVPARFSLLVGLSLAVLSGFGVSRILRSASPRRSVITLSLLAIAIFLDFDSRLELRPVWTEPPAFYAALPDDAVLAELPALGEKAQFSSIPYLYFSIWHGRQMLNGYSGYTPGEYDAVAATIDSLWEPGALDRIRERGATHVTVNCALFLSYQQRCRNIIGELDRLPRLEKVSTVNWSGENAVLYRILD